MQILSPDFAPASVFPISSYAHLSVSNRVIVPSGPRRNLRVKKRNAAPIPRFSPSLLSSQVLGPRLLHTGARPMTQSIATPLSCRNRRSCPAEAWLPLLNIDRFHQPGLFTFRGPGPFHLGGECLLRTTFLRDSLKDILFKNILLN